MFVVPVLAFQGNISLVRKSEKLAFLRFIIGDTGAGIATEHQEYIFEKFSRLNLSNKGTYKGIGLGLRIVKQFICEMGGEIDLRSTLMHNLSSQIQFGKFNLEYDNLNLAEQIISGLANFTPRTISRENHLD